MGEETGNTKIVYLYDDTNSPIGMLYTTDSGSDPAWSAFWFEKNMQGDIVAVYDQNGTKLISYTYDAWGNFEASYPAGESAAAIANINPFRYRGYYYDSDLGLYCVGVRYYDSITGRWISPDKFVSTGQGLTSYNMYAYCGNNPVNRIDPTGEFWNNIVAFVVKIVVFVVCKNIEAVIESEQAVSDNTIAPMDDGIYQSKVKDQDTSNMTEEERIAYIRRTQEDWKTNNDQRLNEWTEAEMLREITYHDNVYRLFDILDMETTDLGKRAKYVDFEEKKTAITYIRRIIGNILW